MEGEQEATQRGKSGNHDAQQNYGSEPEAPEAGTDSRNHHHAHGHKGADGLEPGHEIHDHRKHEGEMHPGPASAYRGQIQGIHGVDNQGPQDHCHNEQGDNRINSQKNHRVSGNGEHGTEQKAHEIHPGATQGNDKHPECQTYQIKHCQGTVLGVSAESGKQGGHEDHQSSGQNAADGHGGNGQSFQEISCGRSRKDGMGQGVTAET